MELFIFQNGKVNIEEVENFDDWKLPEKGFVWMDLNWGEADNWPTLVKHLTGIEVFENHAADSFNPLHPSYSEITEDYEMIIFRSLSPETNKEEIITRPTSFFLCDQLFITISPPDSRSIAIVQKNLKKKNPHLPQKPTVLMYWILNEMVEKFMSLRKPLADQLSAWEENLLESKKSFKDWPLLHNQRKQLGALETLCEEQEDCIVSWKEQTDTKFTPQLEVRFNDLQEHIHRVLNHVQHIKSQMDNLVQLHFSSATHRTNEIMRFLTVMAAIFLPLNLLASIFGMNFENMRIFHYQSAHFFVLGGMGVLALLLLFLFRYKKWI